MGTMNEPQVWTLISVFAAAIFSMLAVVSGLFTHVVRTEIGALAVKVDAKFELVGARFDALDERVDRLDKRVERLERKVEDIDRDVQAISRRVFPDHP